MAWEVIWYPDFEIEHRRLPEAVRRQLASRIRYLRQHGPLLGRPYADTLNGSRHANMKELRISSDGGGWRIAFAFDPNRQAILLLAGNKPSGNTREFYRGFIRNADVRFDNHLRQLNNQP